MLTAAILVPLLGALVVALGRFVPSHWLRPTAIAIAAVPLLLMIVAWLRFDPAGPAFQLVADAPWIPSVGAGWRVGVDGIGLVMATLTGLVFVVALAFPTDDRGRPRAYFGWLLFLEGVCLGFFLALDLLLFYVCFDLSLLGMYFLIGIWGHEDRQRAAITFILYTFGGSLVMLLGILSLVLAMDPISFDMRAIADAQPLAGAGLRAGLTLLAVLVGLGVKTPLPPVHTWLPPAHVEAPAPVSAVLAGILLKMGTFGMIRVAWALMRDTFAAHAFVLAVFAVVAIVYGALVALGQTHIKRRIAYTSITHMGYTVLGIAIAGSALAGTSAARLALTGATLEMVAHALITGSLFLLCGSILRRGESWDMHGYGGLARRAPRFAVALVVAAFASLGMPGLAGFVAEFQIFSGTVATHPWLAGVALVGVLLTAALFLQLLQALLFGEPTARARRFSDLDRREWVSLSLLLAPAVIIGLFPAFVLDALDAASRNLLAG